MLVYLFKVCYTSSFIFDGVFLYGATETGGVNNLGAIFKIKPNGTNFSIFDTIAGSYPKCSLISDRTFLYGITKKGGLTNNGMVFKYKYCTPIFFSQSLILCAEKKIVIGAKTYSVSGVYIDTLISFVNGCDSIVTTHLTILPKNAFTQSPTICVGQSLIVGNKTYKRNGTYIDTLQSLINGCDSIITTHLTVNDTSISILNSTLRVNDSGAGYQWLDCKNDYRTIRDEIYQSYTPTMSGSYAVVLNNNNCNDTSSCHYMTVNCYSHYGTTYDTLKNKFTLTVDSTTTAFANSYYWSFGDGSSSAQPTPSHTYTKDTTYNVCLKITTANNDTCSYCHIIGKDAQGNIYRTGGFALDVANPYLKTAIENNLPITNQYVIYPNPTTGELQVLFNQQITDVSIRVVDVLGKIILEKNNLTGKQFNFDVNNNAAGMYFVEVIQNSIVTRTKLIKQ